MNIDKANVTSIVSLILAPVVSYLGISSATSSVLNGIIVGIIMLGIQIINEKYNSTLISGDSSETTETSSDDEFGAE